MKDTLIGIGVVLVGIAMFFGIILGSVYTAKQATDSVVKSFIQTPK